MLVHRRVTPGIKFAGTHLYTWVERGTVRVKCLAQERNTMSPARPRTRTTRSGVERTNHEDTAPPTLHYSDDTKIPLKNCSKRWKNTENKKSQRSAEIRRFSLFNTRSCFSLLNTVILLNTNPHNFCACHLGVPVI